MTTKPLNLFVNAQVNEAWERIEYVHSMFHDPAIFKQSMLIVGESGEGKTYLLKAFESTLESVTCSEKRTRPIFYYSFKQPKKSVDEMIRLLIDGLGASPPQSRVSSAVLEHQFITLLQELQVELIMLDEIQNIASSYDGIEFQHFIKYLCSLIDNDKIKCSIVFAGTPAAKRLMSFGQTKQKFNDSEQMSRRMIRPMELKRIKPRTKHWIDCVNWFVNQIGLPALTVDENKDLFDRIYVGYNENSLSSLRDLFLQPNCMKASSKEELIQCLKRNFDFFCKAQINPFEKDITQDHLDEFIRGITIKMNAAERNHHEQLMAEFE
ncbi:TniB family NTP-binding protein [Pseudoalteromonas sp. CnMc7-37]|uniref:TniB family NTP-binding protein n=1 Tax=Pseudoalteromonas sp. CnMc7-37 TaxID=2954496 RepID=UPI0020975676|nr:TniB family NTP-binding protein [Pseudoalteromonas sp. CnMc7-37]MCO7204823.1 TniB family NTP-binding protein [Pseudoalteromonas sp. CnMc7-37]